MLNLDAALDFFRTEGWSDPEWSSCHSDVNKTQTLASGRFQNQCGRCLSFVPSARVDLTKTQRIWLCERCSGPNPPVLVFEKPKTWQQITQENRKKLKASEKEQKKREREEARERKKRDRSLSSVRRNRATKGKPEDAESKGPEDTIVRVSGDAIAPNRGGVVSSVHGLTREAEEAVKPVLDQGGAGSGGSRDGRF